MRIKLSPTRVQLLLLSVLILCVIVRLGVLLAFPQYFSFETTGVINGEGAYDVYARNLLKTGVYGTVAGVPDAYSPSMLYTYLLAGVYGVLGAGHIQVGLIQIALDAVSIFFLYHIGRKLFPRGEWVGLLAGVFYALYPYLVFQNLTIIYTPLLMTLLYGFLLTIITMRERERFDRHTLLLGILAGVLLGLLALTRPVVAPVAFVVALWFLLRINLWQTIIRLLPVALISIATLIPWTVRNYQVYHTFVPVSASLGFNLFSGYSRYTLPFLQAGYSLSSMPEFTDNSNDIMVTNTRLTNLAIGYIQTHGNEIPALIWNKLLAYWSINIYPSRNPILGAVPFVVENGQIRVLTDPDEMKQAGFLKANDVYSQPIFDQVARWVHRIYFGGLLLLAIVGLGMTFRYWRSVSLLWLVQLFMTVVFVLTWPATRYRAPTDPLLFLFSAYPLVIGIAWAIRRRKIIQ